MPSKLIDFSHPRRIGILALVYGAIVAISWYLAYEVRFDFLVPVEFQERRLDTIAFVVILKVVALVMVRQLGSVVSYFSIPDLLRIVWAMSCSSVFIFAARLVAGSIFAPPRGVLLVDYLLCLAGLCGVRLAARMYRERINPSRRLSSASREQIAIVGAGDAGASLANEFINSPARGFRVVVFFDDDPEKEGRLVHGVPVVGPPERISEMKEALGVTKLVIAMPSASAKRIREVVALAAQHGLKVETMPTLEELASGHVKISRIRPVEVQDLLGRDAVNLDSAAIKGLIAERVVMVTGAGGSIGSELCRQIAGLNPKRLLMVDQAEGNLFAIEQNLNGLGYGAILTPLVADILDGARMKTIFERYQPEIIFHAAAHKHVFMMERQPAEAFSNNVIGTRRLALLAVDARVKKFVLISTDKAINPTSVMGATKRLAELQLQEIQMGQNGGGTKFIAVRFGNVLGSSGSVIPIFKQQIANGGPVTVTHPEVTRYFMTIPEAVGLVLQSSVFGNGGEIFVLDMGKPVKIVDLARQLITLSGFKPDDIEIKFTGLKPGEKLFEELQHRSELYQPTEHPRIMQFVGATTFNGGEVRIVEQDLHRFDANELKQVIRRLVPEYTPYLD